MREDRDGFILVISILPIVLLIALYVTWRNAGGMGFAIPTPPLPAIPLPQLPDIQQYIPAGVMRWVRALQRNSGSVLPAIALGIMVGLVATGTLIDGLKKLWSAVGVVRREPEKLSDDLSTPDVL